MKEQLKKLGQEYPRVESFIDHLFDDWFMEGYTDIDDLEEELECFADYHNYKTDIDGLLKILDSEEFQELCKHYLADSEQHECSDDYKLKVWNFIQPKTWNELLGVGTERGKKITYEELVKGYCNQYFLCNNVSDLFELDHISWEYACKYEWWKEDEDKDVFQYYLIDDWFADFLKRYTEELVFYCNELDCYVWWITFYGMSWSDAYICIPED